MWWSEQKGKSLRAAAKRFGVSRSSISDWKQAILHGKNLYTPGRPRALDNEARKKNEEEKQKRREQVQLDMVRGQIALEERRKKELADLKAAIERCQAELQEKDRQIDLMKGENGAIREGSPRKKGQKRKNAPSTSSSASNGGQEGFSDGMLRTLTTTFENKVVESLGRDRGEGKRAVKPKLRS